MPKRWRTAAAALLGTSLAAAGCAPDAPPAAEESPDPIEVVDAAGRALTLPGPARRIVSLVPSATATLRAIGASDALVGRTDFDTQDWARAIPSVGGGIEPSLEALVALEPDLVIRFAGEQDPRTGARLDQLGIAHLGVRPERVRDVFEAARMLGLVTAREAASDSLVRSLEKGLEAASAAVASWPRLRVAHVLGGSPPWVTGPDTYISEVLEMVGGDNAFSDLGTAYAAISPEELRTRAIEVVLVSARTDLDERLVPGARIVEIGSALEIPGPDLVDSARRVAEALHGRPLR